MNSTLDLECRNLTKSFGHFTAVERVSLSVPRGSFFSILGPSGCGKTTLMRMLAGFETPDTGDIFIQGQSMAGIPPNKRPVNMVFQQLALFPNMTVGRNIEYGLKRRKVAVEERRKRVGEVLARVGLANYGDNQISQLSGGQQQRVAIARCLVLNPDVLLLDEPLGALDLKLREQMKIELKKLQADFDTTFIYITHDQSEALVMSDQVAVMNLGRFEQVGSPQDLYYRPQTAFVASFVGDNNHWRGEVREQTGNQLLIVTEKGVELRAQCPSSIHPDIGAEVEVFVRPEMVSIGLSPTVVVAENRMIARITSLIFDGAHSQIQLQLEGSDQEIMADLPQTSGLNDLKRGERLHLSWRSHQCSVFISDAGK